MLLFAPKALVRLTLAYRVLQDDYSKNLPSQLHQVFLRMERNVFLPSAQKFNSTKLTEQPGRREDRAE